MCKSIDIELAQLRPKVLALTRKFFSSAHLDSDPEDIVQDVLLNLWRAKQNGTQIKNAEAWAVRATKNACISAWRKKSATAFSRLTPPPANGSHIFSNSSQEHKQSGTSYDVISDGSALDRIRESEASTILQRTMEGFSDGTLKLLRLRAQGLSLDEISAVTGRSKGSVKSSISAARKALIQSLE